MTVINGSQLLSAQPIKSMLATKQRFNGVSHGLSEAGYDIRIKQDVRFYPSEHHTPHHAIFVPSEQHPDFVPMLHIGRFTLASAIEEFDMPADLVGVVHDKSTWARQGLSVFNTVIEPGWKGFLTLELVYHGQNELHIPAGSGIAQVIFSPVSVAAQYDGKYQNQIDKPVDSIWESSS